LRYCYRSFNSILIFRGWFSWFLGSQWAN